MSVQERYSRATLASNLKDDAQHHVCDILAAVALSSDLGSLLFRVRYANDASSYPQLRAAWIEKVTHKADYRHWPTNIKPEKVAAMTLDYWLRSVCEHCNGLGLIKHESAPCLTDKSCKHCDGTGIAPFKCDRSTLKYATDVLDELQALSAIAGSNAIKKLAKQFEI